MNRRERARFQREQAKIIRNGERSRGYNVRSPRHKRAPSLLEEVVALTLLMASAIVILFI